MKNYLYKFCVITFALLTVQSVFAAQTISIASTKSAGVNGLYAWRDRNYGADLSIIVSSSDVNGTPESGAPRRVYAAWDVSRFGKTAQISNAKIILTKAYSQDQGGVNIAADLSMEKPTQGWNEGNKINVIGDSNIPELTWITQPPIVGYQVIRYPDPNNEEDHGEFIWESIATVEWWGNEVIEPRGTQYTFEGESVTNLVREWIAHPEQNVGVVFATHDANTYTCFIAFHSDDVVANPGANPPVIPPLLEFTITGCGEDQYPYPAGDLTRDCYVNFTDLRELAIAWLECTDPNPPCNYQP